MRQSTLRNGELCGAKRCPRTRTEKHYICTPTIFPFFRPTQINFSPVLVQEWCPNKVVWGSGLESILGFPWYGACLGSSMKIETPSRASEFSKETVEEHRNCPMSLVARFTGETKECNSITIEHRADTAEPPAPAQTI